MFNIIVYITLHTLTQCYHHHHHHHRLSILTKYCIYQDSCVQKNMAVEMFMEQFANVKEKNDVFVCRVGVTWSCNKSKLIFRLWNITKGVCLSSINLVLPGTQRTTSGTGTDFIQSFKLIYNFANVWFKKRSTQLVKKECQLSPVKTSISPCS